MANVFLQLAEKVINDEKRPLGASEIWDLAVVKGYDKELATKGMTPWASLGAQLYIDVRDNPNSIFVTIGSRPKRFILRSLVESLGLNVEDDLSAAPLPSKNIEYLEKDLHPFIVYYGFYYLKSYFKTIRHNKSDKKGFGEWVHPDLVGCYFPFSDWKDEVIEISGLMGNTAIRLYSIELKRELSLSNLREAFFQAVSNSSWAHEGYLVAAEIDNNEDFRSELERLSTSFGIGVIKIDVEDPDSTAVILPAKPKDIVDWETINKLAKISPDFREFLKRVKVDISSHEIRKEMYDKVQTKEDLINSIVNKS